jgi:hypothetical protein
MGREQRANSARREAIGQIADRIAGHFIDRGKIIEMGFAEMIRQSYPGYEAMPKQQLDELRCAFFGGAQHLFGSIMGTLDPGGEPTEQDLRRMDLIAHELEAFLVEYKQRYGITDPDIGPEPQTAQ